MTVAVDDGFRGPQVCQLVGITYRQLDYWARTDLIRPTVCDARGSGTQRRYARRDVVDLAIVKALLDAGVGLPFARRALQQLHDQPDGGRYLVINGTAVLLVADDADVVALLRSGRGVLNIVLSLDGIAATVADRIAELRTPAA